MAIVPWTLTSLSPFFQFIIHYFDVIRPVDPCASSLNSWYHSVDFSSQPIIRFGQCFQLKDQWRKIIPYNLIWRYFEIFETIWSQIKFDYSWFRNYVTYIIIIMISYQINIIEIKRRFYEYSSFKLLISLITRFVIIQYRITW